MGRDDAGRHDDIFELYNLKARYFRLMDTKRFAEFGELFTDDLRFYIESTPTPGDVEPTFVGRRALVDYLAASDPRKVTVHQGHMPEIHFTGPNAATGVWAMFDWVDDPGRGGAWQGFGHYHEQYVRGADGQWRIREVRLTRLRVDRVEPRTPLGHVGIDRDQQARSMGRGP